MLQQNCLYCRVGGFAPITLWQHIDNSIKRRGKINSMTRKNNVFILIIGMFSTQKELLSALVTKRLLSRGHFNRKFGLAR